MQRFEDVLCYSRNILLAKQSSGKSHVNYSVSFSHSTSTKAALLIGKSVMTLTFIHTAFS